MSSTDKTVNTTVESKSETKQVDPFDTSDLAKLFNKYRELSAESDTELLLYLAELITIHTKADAIVSSKFDTDESSPEKTKMLEQVAEFKRFLDANLKLLNEFVIAKQNLNYQLKALRHSELVRFVLDEEQSTNTLRETSGKIDD
jgi:hypothetical protein